MLTNSGLLCVVSKIVYHYNTLSQQPRCGYLLAYGAGEQGGVVLFGYLYGAVAQHFAYHLHAHATVEQERTHGASSGLRGF